MDLVQARMHAPHKYSFSVPSYWQKHRFSFKSSFSKIQNSFKKTGEKNNVGFFNNPQYSHNSGWVENSFNWSWICAWNGDWFGLDQIYGKLFIPLHCCVPPPHFLLLVKICKSEIKQKIKWEPIGSNTRQLCDSVKTVCHQEHLSVFHPHNRSMYLYLLVLRLQNGEKWKMDWGT